MKRWLQTSAAVVWVLTAPFCAAAAIPEALMSQPTVTTSPSSTPQTEVVATPETPPNATAPTSASPRAAIPPMMEIENEKCTLSHYGDCCHVFPGSTKTISVETTIQSRQMIDFISMVNRGDNTCILSYSGSINTSLIIESQSMVGTWLGGTFTLAYKSDLARAGQCEVDLYYMNIGSPLMFSSPDEDDPMPACVGGRFVSP